ncbi:hypothetical protein MBLNU230_g5226t1 [Neophaeotheca triangularis]
MADHAPKHHGPAEIAQGITNKLQQTSLTTDMTHSTTNPNPVSTASTAQDRVFNTTALCKAVFEKFSMKDILRATHICKHFRNVVHNSPSLRIKIFLSADTEFSKTWTVEQWPGPTSYLFNVYSGEGERFDMLRSKLDEKAVEAK